MSRPSLLIGIGSRVPENDDTSYLLAGTGHGGGTSRQV